MSLEITIPIDTLVGINDELRVARNQQTLAVNAVGDLHRQVTQLWKEKDALAAQVSEAKHEARLAKAECDKLKRQLAQAKSRSKRK